MCRCLQAAASSAWHRMSHSWAAGSEQTCLSKTSWGWDQLFWILPPSALRCREGLVQYRGQNLMRFKRQDKEIMVGMDRMHTFVCLVQRSCGVFITGYCLLEVYIFFFNLWLSSQNKLVHTEQQQKTTLNNSEEDNSANSGQLKADDNKQVNISR